MAVKLTTYDFYGKTSDAIECIDYAVTMGAKILSNSWIIENNQYSQALKEAIEASDANGVLFVAAAANFGQNNDLYPLYPASYDCNNIIAVMATNHNDEWWWRSSYGPNSVDLAAPGSDILSTTPTFMTSGTGGMSYYGLSTYYGTISGTSMATPRVAGACALVWTVNPTLSHLQVKDIILNTVDKLDALNGLCVTGGRLNLYNAVLEATKQQQLICKDNGRDPNASVEPNEEITYTITCENPVIDTNDPNYLGDLNNVIIVDYLPEEVDYNSSDPCGIYNPITRTVIWNIGMLSPGDSNSVKITVTVNKLAEPLGTVTNVCVFEANEVSPVFATEITDVNAWNPGVIYVDDNAIGSDTGMSWQHAYRDLQDALERASAGCGSEIWVATGTYRPSEKVCYGDFCSVTFQLVDGVAIYGGFDGNETSREQRNPITNQTILTGDLNNDGYGDVLCVVTASNVGQATIIDGFTITRADRSGIYCNDASPTITHNIIQQNYWGIGCENNSSPDIKACSIQDNTYGIGYGNNSALTVTDCIIAGNDNHGIYGDIYGGVNSQLTVSNSIIRFNGYDGIYLDNMLSTTIKNNWIHNNGTMQSAYGAGICFDNQSSVPLVRNNTIYDNFTYGIESSEYSADPNISNCIIYGNGTEDLSWAGTVNYCCLQSTHSGTGNIYGDPCFMNPDDPNDLHIAEDSPCKDTGNPSGNYVGETDIDGEDRVKYGRVDIGGDEYYLSLADFYTDLMVNFLDYAEFALHWQSISGDPDYNDVFDLQDNNSIDYADLAVFCEDWLWQAGWTKEFTCGAGQDMSQTMAAGLTTAQVSYPSISQAQQIEKVEPLKIEQLIDWLEKLWLDEEVQKLIDEDIWQKFIDSLKEYL